MKVLPLALLSFAFASGRRLGENPSEAIVEVPVENPEAKATPKMEAAPKVKLKAAPNVNVVPRMSTAQGRKNILWRRKKGRKNTGN
mmetsp:Transcript_32507/g.47696  ORF Transcript_32507/g.47696 Transcript_32507/m.47696 type:complete len:86 (+) Transcript_32507:415-672(+)